MALAFWGGFASGMSKSIEKNRDRKARQDKVERERVKQVNNDKLATDKAVNDLKLKAEDNMYKLQGDKQKVMSEDYSGTGGSRISAINAINGRMQDVSRTSNDRAVKLGSQPIVDISNYDTTPQAVKDIDGINYLVPQDLAAQVDDMGDEMKFVGNEVHQAVYEQNSQGQPILQKDENGNVVYEDSGIKLQKYDDVFKKSKDKDGGITDTQYESYVKTETKAGRVPDSKVAWVAKEKTRPSGSALVDSTMYARSLTSGKAEYDEETALRHESAIQNTKAFTPKFQTRVDDFEKSAIQEQNYDELEQLWSGDIDAGRYNSGIISSIKQSTVEYIGTNLAGLVNLTGEQVASRLNVDTKIGDTVARYVKLISGAAATDAERANLTNIIFGSSWKSEEVRLAKFKSFIQSRKSDNNKVAKSLLSKAPATAGNYLYGKDVARKKKENESDIPVQPTRQVRMKTIREARPDLTDAQIDKFLKSIGE